MSCLLIINHKYYSIELRLFYKWTPKGGFFSRHGCAEGWGSVLPRLVICLRYSPPSIQNTWLLLFFKIITIWNFNEFFFLSLSSSSFSSSSWKILFTILKKKLRKSERDGKEGRERGIKREWKKFRNRERERERDREGEITIRGDFEGEKS